MIVEEKKHEADESISSGSSGSSGSEGAFNEETGEINWDCPVGLPEPPAAREFYRLKLALTDDYPVLGRHGERALWGGFQRCLFLFRILGSGAQGDGLR